MISLFSNRVSVYSFFIAITRILFKPEDLEYQALKKPLQSAWLWTESQVYPTINAKQRPTDRDNMKLIVDSFAYTSTFFGSRD